VGNCGGGAGCRYADAAAAREWCDSEEAKSEEIKGDKDRECEARRSVRAWRVALEDMGKGGAGDGAMGQEEVENEQGVKMSWASRQGVD
jgi:hypothetical protein